LPHNYNNREKITRITVPKLIIHGEDDRLVPFSMGQRLYKEAKPPKSFFPVNGADHNDTYIIGGKEYFKTLSEFIKDSKN
jgi:fermentation-respiration switch protein FrsA (DUF1100 family)